MPKAPSSGRSSISCKTMSVPTRRYQSSLRLPMTAIPVPRHRCVSVRQVRMYAARSVEAYQHVPPDLRDRPMSAHNEHFHVTCLHVTCLQCLHVTCLQSCTHAHLLVGCMALGLDDGRHSLALRKCGSNFSAYHSNCTAGTTSMYPTGQAATAAAPSAVRLAHSRCLPCRRQPRAAHKCRQYCCIQSMPHGILVANLPNIFVLSA